MMDVSYPPDDIEALDAPPRYSLPSPPKRRILILTADAGFGHRSAANAVADALVEQYGALCNIQIVNPLDDRLTPFFLRDSQSDYDRLVKNMPELYRFGYDASDATVPAVIAEQALTVLMFEVMRDLVRSHRPDVILSTYPLYQAPLRAVMTIFRWIVPVMVAVTDLATVHRLWFNSGVDQCFVPTEGVRGLALDAGLAPEQVQVTGIPVNPAIVSDQRSQAQIRQDLGLLEDRVTVLAVGSRRVDRLLDAISVLNHYGAPLQLVVVAGKDETLFRQLQEMDWHVPVRLYEYYPNVPELIKASDWVVCKAGGLIVTESLACGRPMMLIDAIPGQETGNADFVVQNGSGDLVLSNIEILETTAHYLMDDRRLLRLRTENAARLGKPNAAYDIAQTVWEAAQHHAMSRRRGTGRLRLINLLTRNHVHWEEE